MNLDVVYPALFGAFFGAFALFTAIRRKVFIEALPSLAWLVLATLPYIYLSGYFRPDATAMQAWGLAAFAFALAAGDAVSAVRRKNFAVGTTPERIGTFICWFLAAVVVILPIVHVISAQDIPLVDQLTQKLTPEQSAMVRERFSKLLDIPVGLKFAFNWMIVIGAPFLAAMLFKRRLYLLFGVTVLWCSAYAVISSARLPFILFVVFTTFAIMNGAKQRTSNRLVAAVSLILLLIVPTGIYRGETLYNWYESLDWNMVPSTYRAEFKGDQAKTPLQMSPADVERLALPPGGLQRPSSFGQPGDYAIYRAFLSPMEVSNRWYEYFPAVEGDWRPVDDLLPINKPSGWQHASNKVGIWAYVRRFPRNYFNTIHAYASADADAYSFGGLSAVFLAALILGLSRVTFGLIGNSGEAESVLAGLGIAFLTALPFQASVQAILASQGLLLVIVAILVLALGRRLFPLWWQPPHKCI
jgi:hypothetical protein